MTQAITHTQAAATKTSVPSKVYGCHNRKPYGQKVHAIQDGWFTDGMTKTAKLISIPFVMSNECQYTHTENGRKDERCMGCKWKAE